MNIRTNHLLSLGILLSFMACSPATMSQFQAGGNEPMVAKQLHSLITGQGLRMEAIDFEADVHYQTGGHLIGKSFQGDSDSGTWSITAQDQLCMKFHRWYYGDLNCYTVFKDNDNYLFFTSNGARYYSAVSIGKKRGYPADFSQDTPPKKDPIQPEQLSPLSSEDKQRLLHKLAKNCSGCNFSQASLQDANLVGAQLAKADLSGADLTHANLSRANLAGANLTGADLTDCNLSGTDLSGSNLRSTKLTGALFIGANLTGAQFDTSEILKSLQGK